jgi:YesN/AraC family two-component response regulator
MFYEKIVAIDDNVRALESLRLILHKSYEVVCFTDGAAALDYLRKPNSVHLVMTDVVMQGLDGIAVLGEIKKIDQEIPVIIMTAFGSKDIAVRALQNGADDFIEKPFQFVELQEKVRSILKKKPRFPLEEKKPSNRLKYFVERNFAHANLKDIADEACLSEKYVSRLFKKMNNCNFRDFKINVKIEKAKELLRDSSHMVHHISEMLGYQNPETFMRLFKRKTSMTPLQYRKLEQGAHERRGDPVGRPV